MDAEDRWTPGPHQPRLAEGAVHVWRVDLDAVADDLGELLSSEERERAERLLGERERGRWMRSRGLLRRLLGSYLRTDPSALRFTTGANGKPALLDDSHRSAGGPSSSRATSPRAHFNLSHSDRLALYAFSRSGSVGVDIEIARRMTKEVAIAARAFGPQEARRLAELDPATREREFLRAWVRHEARLKCSGTGIGGAASGTGIGGAGIGAVHGAPAGAGEPWIAELDVGSGAAGAVALEREPRELRRWDWRV